jgi:hypothetical protein
MTTPVSQSGILTQQIGAAKLLSQVGCAIDALRHVRSISLILAFLAAAIRAGTTPVCSGIANSNEFQAFRAKFRSSSPIRERNGSGRGNHEEVARDLERRFGYDRVQGAHVERESSNFGLRRRSHSAFFLGFYYVCGLWSFS